MKLTDLKPINQSLTSLEAANENESASDKKITRSPPLPKACIHCKELFSFSGQKGIATWPVCTKCFNTRYHGDLTAYLKAWVEYTKRC